MKGVLIFFLILVAIVGAIYYKNIQDLKKKDSSQKSPVEEKSINEKGLDGKISSESIFVPYWGLDKDLGVASFDKYYYFGVSFDEKGEIEHEDGFGSIDEFINIVGNKAKKYLVIRLVNQDFNKKLISDIKLQEKIINQSASIAQQKGFEGVVLDFETSVLGFASIEKTITSFIENFSKTIHSGKKEFYITLYGDTYYRGRPYDVGVIAEVSDRVIIMAYDFHKARGDGGPNFPFDDNSEYPYDFKKMVDDFKKDVPAEKIEITFGLFGYDWTKGETGLAESYSYGEIKQKFIENCMDCTDLTNNDSQEGHILYKEGDVEHDVWYETPKSVEIKKKYANEKGITHFSAWAYSYY